MRGGQHAEVIYLRNLLFSEPSGRARSTGAVLAVPAAGVGDGGTRDDLDTGIPPEQGGGSTCQM
jgi:hypothetical protein